MEKLASNFQCLSYCAGDSYDLLAISEHFTKEGYAHSVYGRDVLHLDAEVVGMNQDSSKGDIFIYSYGCAVFWGLERLNEERMVNMLREFLDKPLSKLVVDRCNYSVNPNIDSAFIDNELDEICLQKHDIYITLAFSYGLSQSVKLGSFEESVQKTIKENTQIPESLINSGKISLSKKDLAKKIGILFSERNLVSLNKEFFDTPDFFWRRPKYEPYYEMSLKFIDLKQRVQILNNRLDVIHELYGIVSAELQHAHSLRLELIVILLIFIEVILAVLKDIMHWF
ncbi:RMD1 family protein [Lyticum sinuosum]|uniref:DUF155 super family protein n=1 Tax=Lyticum sinuosum TaxID=1332059 RepID=A0AAE4VM80_9RICK|nr:RMD1 family protein [Lyticum sinuosum]MDZ5761229.1 DUF155 super family protein [Lyticum sinuosum]